MPEISEKQTVDPKAETRRIDMRAVLDARIAAQASTPAADAARHPSWPARPGGSGNGTPGKVSSSWRPAVPPAVPLSALVLLAAMCSCVPLDFGGDDEKAWELRPFWDTGIEVGEEDPENPGYDLDGNKIPPPEVVATYAMPDFHAGYALLAGGHPRLTPTLNVEVLEFKVPWARWFVVAVGAGTQEAHIYVGKRLTSIIEITLGPILARDFEEDDWTFGFQGTLIKW